jgi:hypothetical protein
VAMIPITRLIRRPHELPRAILDPECVEKLHAAKQTRSAPTLSGCSQNRGPYCTFSGLGDCPNKIILPFPSPEVVPTPIYVSIHQLDYSATSSRVRTPR